MILGAILISGDSPVNNVQLFKILIEKGPQDFVFMLFKSKIIHKMWMQVVSFWIGTKVTNNIAGRLTVNQNSCLIVFPRLIKQPLKGTLMGAAKY